MNVGFNFWFYFFNNYIFFQTYLKMGFSWEFVSLGYGLGEDLLSYTLVSLSFWICFLMILASFSVYKENFFQNLFLFFVVFLLISLIMTFSSLNLFIFYLFFEISLVPTLFLIIGWGNQPERVSAGVYLFFYTLLMSLPMMVALFYLYIKYSSMEFIFFMVENNPFLYLCLNMVFFVKIPLFLVHLWLPKAHVEAPIAGSMILAGIMLKLGGYGLMRVMKLFIGDVGLMMNEIFIFISLIGGFVISLECIRQSDMKMLIAYSSVSHMGLVVSGILSLSLWGMSGSLILMLAHGLSSSGLFCLANILYERSGSRSFYLNKGMMNIYPSLALCWFLLCSSNMSAPPSLNLLGEIILIYSIFNFFQGLGFILFIMVFFSAVYSLFLFSFTQHGSLSSSMYSMSQISVREFFLVMLHWLPLNVMFLKLESFSLWI
uniref:NADH-ubiquinone oxidoreductase chain 4 n=1 Tax=Ips calligraphus TaxID=102827 RepID=A0A8B0KFH0_9CUCU|nr:NADH dehydrogenase subunit 4 [Ips calligraphus]QTV76824.1 NADH dehydrogenase subunit 4 [Ips calligraphus]